MSDPEDLFREHGELTEAMFTRGLTMRDRLRLAVVRSKIDSEVYAPFRSLAGVGRCRRLRRAAVANVLLAACSLSADVSQNGWAPLNAVALWALRKLEAK